MKRYIVPLLLCLALLPLFNLESSETPFPNSAYIWGDFNESDGQWRGASNLSDKIIASRDTVVALDASGTPVIVYSSDPDHESLQFPGDLTGARDIAYRRPSTLIATAEGGVLYFGSDGSPVADVPTDLVDVVDVELGFFGGAAISSDGGVRFWGWEDVTFPDSPVTSIHSSSFHAAAILRGGEVFLWGKNDRGQADVPNGLGEVVQVACGRSYTLLLTADGELVTVGGLPFNIPQEGTTGVLRMVNGEFHHWFIKEDGTFFTVFDSEAGPAAEDFGQLEFPPAYDDIHVVAAGRNITVGLTARPVIAPQPTGNALVSVRGGEELRLEAFATGPGPLSYRWFYNDEEIVGAIDQSYVVSRTLWKDEGFYLFEVANAHGSITSNPILVEVRNGELVFLEQPQSVQVAVGEPFELAVEAAGIEPLAFQWRKNDEPIPGASGFTYAIDSATFADIGVYEVIVTNGRETSDGSDRVTVDVASPPIVTSQPGELIVEAGTMLTLDIEYEAKGSVTVSWFKDNELIEGQLQASLSVQNVQSSHAGTYVARFSDTYGETDTDPIFVTVLPVPPTITRGPASRSAQEGKIVSFSVEASGSEPFEYQWARNGEPVVGATGSILVLRDFESSDSGDYSVEVRNNYGSVVADPAALSILRLPDGSIDIPDLGFETLPFEILGTITSIVNAGDGSGRLFVSTKAGQVWIVEDDVLLGEPFLDLEQKCSSGNESGLLSLVFPHSFVDRGRFYVAYTPREGDEHPRLADDSLRVARFSVDPSNPNMALVDSEEVILQIEQEQDIHYGGQISFGPDGLLYVAVGDDARPPVPGRDVPRLDGQAALRAQDLGEFYGKILRIDPEGVESGYRVPEDNPFVAVEGALPEVWVSGLRNAWRFSFDEITGDCFIADVGDMTWEELNHVPAGSGGGQNFGWPLFEGLDARVDATAEGLAFPIFSYQRAPSASPNTQALASIIGGYVYRGVRNPRMHGFYLSGDFASRSVYSTISTDSGWSTKEQNRVPGFRTGQITTFGVDEEGEVYVTAPASFSATTLARIHDTYRVSTPRIMLAETGEPLATLYHDHPITLILETITPEAIIRYTLDGTMPDENSPVYADSLWIDRSVNLVVRAFREDLEPSLTAGLNLGFFVRLSVTPDPFLTEEPVLVAVVASTPDAVIRYTNDGSDPSEDSPVFESPSWVQPAERLKLQGFRDGFEASTVWEVFFPARIAETVVVEKLAGGVEAGYAEGDKMSARFNYPSGLLWDSDRNAVLVADWGNQRVRSITESGVATLVGTGITGRGNGSALSSASFEYPVALAHGLDGDLLISDFGNRLVRVLSKDGWLDNFSGESIREPGQMVVRDDGSVLIGTGERPPSIKLLKRGFPSETFYTSELDERDGGFDGFVGLAFLPDGAIAGASEGPIIARISPEGAFSVLAGSVSGYSDGPFASALFLEERLTGPYWLRMFASAPDGSVLVSDWGRIRHLRTDGVVTTLIADDGSESLLGSIRGLCVDDAGTVYASDADTHSIYRIAFDVDRDGVADIDETVESGLEVGVNESLMDTDGDGLSDAQEFHIGTSRSDPADRPQLDFVWNESESRMEINAPVFRGHRSLLESSANLRDWSVEGEWLGADRSEEQLSIGRQDAGQFFRLRIRREYVLDRGI